MVRTGSVPDSVSASDIKGNFGRKRPQLDPTSQPTCQLTTRGLPTLKRRIPVVLSQKRVWYERNPNSRNLKD